MFGIYYTTMLLNLEKSEEDLWKQIGGLRTDVRKWEKNNLEVVLNPSQQDIQDSYELYLTMMKKKFLPVLRSYSLEENDTRKTIVIKKDGKVISYISYQLFSEIDKLWKTKICALETIATDDAFLKYAPNTLLYWEWIKYMKSLGFEYLNFNGVSYEYAEKELYPLARYKRKWNGIEIRLFSKKSLLWYIYWRFFRKYSFVKKIIYKLLLSLFPSKYLKY